MATRPTTTSAASAAPTSSSAIAAGVAGNGFGSVSGLFVVLIALNIAAWAWALVVCQGRPALLGTALLAWVFGLRHAVDADHIAAIDNTVRKLMQQGERPVTTGLFFSLGHSTVVFVAVALLAATTAALKDDLASFRSYGGVIGFGLPPTALSRSTSLGSLRASPTALLRVSTISGGVPRGAEIP